MNCSSVAALAACLLVSIAQAQSPGEQPASGLHRTAKGPGADDPGTARAWTDDPDKHPLMPALRWAKEALQQIEQIDSYTATLIKRERTNGKMGPTESLAIKVRQKPLSIYAKSLGPQSVKGQEVLYVDGVNNGKMWAHGVGLRAMLGTLAINPTDPLAMQGQQYPLTEIGILKLTERLVEIAGRDAKFGECTTKWIDHVKVNDRACHCIEVVHPQRRDNFLFHVARIFVDDELDLPVRYERYDWPSAPGGRLPLIEEYTYLDVKRNAGLADADFDVRNPAYHFRPADREAAAKGEPQGTRSTLGR
jgi:hypothetical protein